MAIVSTPKQLELKTSRSGRLLIPRLKSWTGERVVVRKKGVVEILDGTPDCTSTFESERTLFKLSASVCLSQSLSTTKKASSPPKRIKKYLSESLPNPVKFKEKLTKGKTRHEEAYNKTRPSKCKQKSLETSSTKKGCSIPINTHSQVVCEKVQNKIQDSEINIFGPEFQPVVRLVRLLPDEILSLTRPSELVRNNKLSNFSPVLKIKRVTNKKKSPSDEPRAIPAKSPSKMSPKGARPVTHGRRRTVRDTQKMLEALNQPASSNDHEDEATSTGAFFRNSFSKQALKNLHEVDDILNNDFGESDDNLSFRSMYERESSPISAPVSPISSFHDTDAENSGWEDGPLGASPAVAKPTNFQRAQLLHRTLKSRVAASKKLKKMKKIDDEDCTPGLFPPIAKVAPNPTSCPLLQPKVIHALEKDLKKRVKTSQKWDFSTYYRGNLLHVSLNSDSDDDSSVDSLDLDS